jgi:hypothetical protein
VALRLRFVPGRQGFTVGSITDLEGALNDVIAQINSGELDALIVRPKVEKKAKTVKTPKDAAKPTVAEPAVAAKKSWRKSA